MLAIRLMRMGAKKSPTYRVVVKEKLSKRDGAYLENLGTYNPTREPAEVKLNMERVRYWLARGAQPTDTVRQLIKGQTKAAAAIEAASAIPKHCTDEGVQPAYVRRVETGRVLSQKALEQRASLRTRNKVLQ